MYARVFWINYGWLIGGSHGVLGDCKGLSECSWGLLVHR